MAVVEMIYLVAAILWIVVVVAAVGIGVRIGLRMRARRRRMNQLLAVVRLPLLVALRRR
ncbi:hypothetical protein NIIDNTM18_39540 [Mycolicibacterium litorale]|uniref:Uncharacterized protein n=1 Tax=Mycolicibacterium litorale TaxID=758802 RepID=A0A6S6P9H7_9MYCO|nr:hypothetical protein [Mycolicibacterium litorale]BCI54676.1 hypothetical protein NIIDNTM18_39540 [Mycolicibacterium litorale]